MAAGRLRLFGVPLPRWFTRAFGVAIQADVREVVPLGQTWPLAYDAGRRRVALYRGGRAVWVSPWIPARHLGRRHA